MRMGIWVILALLSASLFAETKPTFTTKQYREKHGLGLKRDVAKFKAFKAKAQKFTQSERADVSVPGQVDLSSQVSPPEDQGQCGSCWAFGITKALRSAWMLVGKDPGTLAFNYLVKNCGGVVSEYGCNGGDFDAGQNFLNNKGPWLESEDPYQETDSGGCKKGLVTAATAVNYLTVGPGNRPPTFKELAQVLAAKHMLVIDVAVCGRWESYSDGIFNVNECGPESINHIINRVGYDCQTSVDAQGNCVFGADGNTVNHDGYFKDENNWNVTWGEKGYIREKWHVDASGDTAMFFTVDYIPAPSVDGSYSDWSACVNGIQTRTCSNPAPANGGKDCTALGPATQSCVVPVPPTPAPTPSGTEFPWWEFVLIAIAAILGFFAQSLVEKTPNKPQ